MCNCITAEDGIDWINHDGKNGIDHKGNITYGENWIDHVSKGADWINHEGDLILIVKLDHDGVGWNQS